MAGLRPQREVEDEEDGPGRRGDEAAITEVPQRHTGHGGRASIALHYTAAERERERGHMMIPHERERIFESVPIRQMRVKKKQ